eukprot:3721387-Prymnesium_polylepis.1
MTGGADHVAVVVRHACRVRVKQRYRRARIAMHQDMPKQRTQLMRHSRSASLHHRLIPFVVVGQQTLLLTCRSKRTVAAFQRVHAASACPCQRGDILTRGVADE